jgi:hypothetical protein
MATPLRGESDSSDTPGVAGFSNVSDGARGDSRSSAKNGVVGGNSGTEAVPSGIPGGNGVFGFTANPNASGVFGANNATNPATAPGGSGVFGFTNAPGAAGVFGANNTAHGVGVQGNGPEAGVSGFSTNGAGVLGRSSKNAVVGQTASDTDAGVNGRNDGKGFGVFGFSQHGSGVEGHSGDGPGVVGFSEKGLAGRFIGNVEVTGDIRLVNADIAEDFASAATSTVEAGTVMVLDVEGELSESTTPYDKRVAGIVSGAGEYKPAIILDRHASLHDRVPVALMGKVVCNVDADESPIEVGDLLTTSSYPGHAMKAIDPARAFGAVIGKALRPLASGRGKIPVLVALQ